MANFRDHSAVGVTRSQSFELSESGHRERSIRGEGDIGLKISQGRFGQRSKDAVHPAGVKPQEGERLLEHDDVISTQVGTTDVKEAITETPRGFLQHVPRVVINPVAKRQTPLDLKGLNGTNYVIVIDVTRNDFVAESRQTVANYRDFR